MPNGRKATNGLKVTLIYTFKKGPLFILPSKCREGNPNNMQGKALFKMHLLSVCKGQSWPFSKGLGSSLP